MGDLDIQNSTVQSDHGTEQGEWSSRRNPGLREAGFPPLLLFKAGTAPPNRLKALLLSGSCTPIQEGAIWSEGK